MLYKPINCFEKRYITSNKLRLLANELMPAPEYLRTPLVFQHV